MIEMNLYIFFILMLGGIILSMLLPVVGCCRVILAEVFLLQAERYSLNQLADELSYNGRAVEVKVTYRGRRQLDVETRNGCLKRSYYLNNHKLYRRTSRNGKRGVNPCSLEQIRVSDLQVDTLGPDRMRLRLRMEEPGGRVRECARIVRLLNGRVTGGGAGGS